jgi:hypothetical protein
MVLFSLKLAYGSLDKLENETNAELPYRAALENYLTSHNITLGPTLELNNLNIFELETFVKAHMNDCQSGHHDRMVDMFKTDKELDNETRTELLNMYGDC